MEKHLIVSQEVRFNCRMESSFPVCLQAPNPYHPPPPPTPHVWLLTSSPLKSTTTISPPLSDLAVPFLPHSLFLFLPSPTWLNSFALFGCCFPPHSFQKCPRPRINKPAPAFSLDILSPSSHKGRRGCSRFSCVLFHSLPFLLICPNGRKPDVWYFIR